MMKNEGLKNLSYTKFILRLSIDQILLLSIKQNQWIPSISTKTFLPALTCPIPMKKC